MGKYDDITGEQLRGEILRFARLVLRLEERGELLDRSPDIMQFLGELRRMIFAWEVRGTKDLLPELEEAVEETDDDPLLRESLRIVREALDRQRELQDELDDDHFPGDDPPAGPDGG